MSRNILFFVFLFIFTLFSFGFCEEKQQQGAEEITITTYYPSPYGSYNELQTNKMAVGDTNGDTKLDSGDQSVNNGDLVVAGNVGIGTKEPNYKLEIKGNLSAGPGFSVSSNGVPIWGGKKFKGYTTVEVQTGTTSSCRCKNFGGKTCQQICSSYGETCVHKWYQCFAHECIGQHCYGPNPCSDVGIDGDCCECSKITYEKVAVPTFE